MNGMIIQKDEILTILEQIKERGLGVRLLNVYKGIPITQEAQMLDITGKVATFNINRYQAVCLELQRKTFIQHHEFPAIVKGNVIRVDIRREIAYLSAFVYMGGDIGNRLQVRVQPKDPIPVELAMRGQLIRGHLADISIGGAGIFTTAIFYRPGFFSFKSPATINVYLPTAKTSLKLPGVVVYLRPDVSAYRLGIQVNPDMQTRALISQYVAHRQAEIQRELRQVYDVYYQKSESQEVE